MKVLSVTLATTALLSGCDDGQQIDDVDFAQYCGDTITKQVAMDEACALTGDNPTSRFQWAYADTGHHTWVNGYDTTPDYVFIPVGQPMPTTVIYTRPYNYGYRKPLARSATPVHRASSLPYAQFKKTAPKVPAAAPKAATPAPAPAPKPPAAPAKNPGIERGGFGVPSAPRVAPPPAPKFGAPTPTKSFSSTPSTPKSGK